jgi:hypothetical protein
VTSIYATPVASHWTVKFGALTDCTPRSQWEDRPSPRVQPPRRSSRRRTGISTSSFLANCQRRSRICQSRPVCSKKQTRPGSASVRPPSRLWRARKSEPESLGYVFLKLTSYVAGLDRVIANAGQAATTTEETSSCTGLTCHLGYWWRFISLLNCVRIVAIDFAVTASASTATRTALHYERDLLSLLDALDLDRITVARRSHGRYVTLFAASRGEKIRRVPAIDVKSDWTHEDADLAERSRDQRSGVEDDGDVLLTRLAKSVVPAVLSGVESSF